MALVKELLTAANHLKPEKRLRKKSIATELAPSSSQPDPATELATELDTSSVSENVFLIGDNDLEKIVALLLWMSQDFASNIHVDDIHYAALEVIIKHADAATGGTLGSLHTVSVAKLSELIDICLL